MAPPPTDSYNSYNWAVQQPASGVNLSATTGGTCNVQFAQTGTYTIIAYGTSNCATSTTPTYIFVYNVTSPSGGYSSTTVDYMATVYPNPSSSVLNIEIKDNTAVDEENARTNIASAAQATTDNFRIRLYDEHGNLVHHTHTKKGHKMHFSVAHLKNGIYYLNIQDETTGKTEKQQIIVKH